MIDSCEIKEKANPNYLELGTFSEIMGISIGIGIAKNMLN